MRAGGIRLVPAEQIPRGTWLIGTGFLLLAPSVYRRVRGIAVHVLGTVPGALALAGELWVDVLDLDLPVLAYTPILAGTWLNPARGMPTPAEDRPVGDMGYNGGRVASAFVAGARAMAVFDEESARGRISAGRTMW